MVVWTDKNNRLRAIMLISLALIVVTMLLYSPARDHGFLNFDDTVYVTANPHVKDGFDASDISWAFSSFHAGNWHPITWMSHLVDAHLFGLNPRGHHFTSVAIHALVAVVLFLFLVRASGMIWQSAFVAGWFAVHPLHVESVAWVAERKDVLSALFWFLTLLFYAVYADRRKRSLYLLSLCSFILGLMTKPMLVTLPLVMLLLDYWPLGRFTSAAGGMRPVLVRLVQEKLPFLAFSLLSSVVTIFAQRSGGAVQSFDSIPFADRVGNALVSYVVYLGNLFWPDDLAILYPFPPSIPLWQSAGALAVLLAVTVTLVRARRRYPYLVVGWFWYLVTLVPVIGIIQVGVQAMADRYTYLPSIGLFIMVAWGVPDLLRPVKCRQLILVLLAAGVIVGKSVATWQQLAFWRDDITLYRRTLEVTTGNYIIHNNLGTALANRWDLDGAIPEFREALRIYPRYVDARYNLGMALAMKGDLDGALRELKEVQRIDPRNGKVSYSMGRILEQMRWQQENRY